MQNLAKQPETNSNQKRLVLMRGLPSCGKSWTAKRIAEQGCGSVFEFDTFFEVPNSDGASGVQFVWDRSRLPEAGRWHVQRVREAIEAGVTPLVLDDDHRPGKTTKALVAYAMMNHYSVEFAEPESAWWKTIRELLRDKTGNAESLAQWAKKLCNLNRQTHGVHLETFVSRMKHWEPELSPLDLISWGELPTTDQASAEEVAA